MSLLAIRDARSKLQVGQSEQTDQEIYDHRQNFKSMGAFECMSRVESWEMLPHLAWTGYVVSALVII